MKTISVLKSVAIAAALVAASLSASAATTDLGAVASDVPTSFGGYAMGSFADIFTFSLPANSGSGYSVVNFPVSTLAGTFNVLLSGLGLFSNPDDIVGNADDSYVTAASGNSNALSFSFANTPAGNYYLQVFGVTTGSLGGLYTGAISVTPVPEPETFAMLMAGFGVMGAIARRRKIQG
jgi:hypothetical protein